MKHITLTGTITSIILVLLSIGLIADQQVIIDCDRARDAYDFILKSDTIYHFCEPCGDPAPKKDVVQAISFSGRGGSCSIKVNGKDVDLAYVFVKSEGAWKNLAHLMGLQAMGVSPVLDESRIPVDQDAKKAKEESDLPYLSLLEKEFVDECNLARTNPGEYAKILGEMRKYYNGRYMEVPGRHRLRTNEGVPALDEAVRFLEAASPLPPLEPSKGMSAAAREHVSDTGPRGALGHSGSDGSSPMVRLNRHGRWQNTAGENISYGKGVAREILVQLIVDDGVPGRGHRRNIFNPAFRRIGVAYGPHKQYGHMCVQTFAGAYQEK